MQIKKHWESGENGDCEYYKDCAACRGDKLYIKYNGDVHVCETMKQTEINSENIRNTSISDIFTNLASERLYLMHKNKEKCADEKGDADTCKDGSKAKFICPVQ